MADEPTAPYAIRQLEVEPRVRINDLVVDVSFTSSSSAASEEQLCSPQKTERAVLSTASHNEL